MATATEPRAPRLTPHAAVFWTLAAALGLALPLAGCGPPEAGTIKLPEELRRTGPGGIPSKPVSTGPGDFVVEPPKKSGQAKGFGR